MTTEYAIEVHTADPRPAKRDTYFNAGGDLVQLWLQRYDRASTRAAYTADLADFFGASWVTLDMAKAVGFVQANEYLQRMEGDGLTPSTMKRRVAAVRGFFEWLVALGALDRNPFNRHTLRRIRTARRQDRAVPYLTPDQARALVAEAGNNGDAAVRDQTLIKVLLHCVLRRSEAAAMDCEHIRQLGAYWVLNIPEAKGGADQVVKVPDHVVEAIEAMKAHYGITSGPLWRSTSNRGRDERLSGPAIYDIVKRTAARVGLDIGAHVLRHTGCTLAIEAGASLQQVQTHARHKSLETTMVYIHQRDRLRDSAADMIRI
jgi:integrase